MVDGETYSQPEPELDWVDIAILDAWHALNADLCICGRPRAIHATEAAADYVTGVDTCPAIAALDEQQAAKSIDDEDAMRAVRDRVEQGKASRADRIAARLNMDRPRSWFVWHHTRETPPD